MTRLALLLVAAVLLMPSAAQASCGQVCKLKQQNSALKKQVRALRSQRDVARAELAQAQSGVAGAISTMPPEQVWGLMREIGNIFQTTRYSASYYKSSDNYESWSFTFCGFC